MSTQIIRTAILGIVIAAGASACSKSGDQQAENTQEAPAAPAAATCDATCLNNDLDLVLEAMIAHDPSKAPLADNVRYTENGVQLELNDGLWGTASGMPTTYKLTVPDPTLGQIAFHILMQESGDPIWLGGRLKVENQKITEIEAIVIRKDGGFGNFERTLAPIWTTVVDPAQRVSREKMADIANMYFDALQDNKADYVPFADDCGRVENGITTANDPNAKARPGGPNIGILSCAGNINSMMWRYITKIDQRRTVAIDEEHGIVSVVVMFNHAGTADSTEIPGFGEYKYTGSAHQPFNALVLETFKVVDGQVHWIAATLDTMPYGFKTGW